MERRKNFKQMVREELAGKYRIRRIDIGPDARLKKMGLVFETQSFEVEGLGHLCLMRMSGFAGLMKMETLILAVTEKDVPLFNLDWLKMPGKEIQISELYNTQLRPYPQKSLDVFQRIKDRDSDLKDRSAKSSHIFDSVLYSCSYGKEGRGISRRLNTAAEDYLRAFTENLESAPACDPAEKKKKIQDFVLVLFSKGGPAVGMIAKLFGEETAKRLVLKHMYGVL